jgi:hypothetical protein
VLKVGVGKRRVGEDVEVVAAEEKKLNQVRRERNEGAGVAEELEDGERAKDFTTH